MKLIERIAYREISTRVKPPVYATRADIEDRQRLVFERIAQVLDTVCTDGLSCYIALETTIPGGGIRGAFGGKRGRKPFDIAKADGIPENYWVNVKIFPVAEVESEMYGTCGKVLTIPILTVRRRYGLWGDCEIVLNMAWERELMQELPKFTKHANRIEEASFIDAEFAMKRIVRKRASIAI